MEMHTGDAARLHVKTRARIAVQQVADTCPAVQDQRMRSVIAEARRQGDRLVSHIRRRDRLTVDIDQRLGVRVEEVVRAAQRQMQRQRRIEVPASGNLERSAQQEVRPPRAPVARRRDRLPRAVERGGRQRVIVRQSAIIPGRQGMRPLEDERLQQTQTGANFLGGFAQVVEHWQ